MNKKILGSVLIALLFASGCSSTDEEKVDNKEVEITDKAKGEEEMKNMNETLKQVIESADVVTESNYTEESYTEYKKAVDAAKAVKENKAATKEELEAAVTSVAVAKNKLEKKKETAETSEQEADSSSAVSGVTNGKVVFGFTIIEGKYNSEQVDKIDFFIGESTKPRTVKLNDDGTFTLEIASDIGQLLKFKAYKGSEVVQEGEYTVI